MGKAISWPAFFEPKLLACGRDQVTALTPRGFGATASMDDSENAAKAFTLTGLTNFPPMVGASWGPRGLVLISRSGHLAECAGVDAAKGDAWPCGQTGMLPQALPGSTHRFSTASVANVTGQLHAAVVREDIPELVALYVREEGGDWLPVGEARVPGVPAKVSVSFSGDSLLVATSHGRVLRRRLSDGEVTDMSVHALGEEGVMWMGACALDHPAEVAHLHFRQGDTMIRRPEVVVVNS